MRNTDEYCLPVITAHVSVNFCLAAWTQCMQHLLCVNVAQSANIIYSVQGTACVMRTKKRVALKFPTRQIFTHTFRIVGHSYFIFLFSLCFIRFLTTHLFVLLELR